MSPKELVMALFSAAFVDHDPDAARALVTPDYIQHNPQVETGADGLVNLIPFVEQSGMTVTTHRVILKVIWWSCIIHLPMPKRSVPRRLQLSMSSGLR